jgi:dCTP deaminase
MIWSDVDIKRGLAEGEIFIDPSDEKAIQPASVDVRLGNCFFRFCCLSPIGSERCDQLIDPRKDVLRLMEKFYGPVIILLPGEFLLGVTVERVRLTNTVVARVEGKSSLGRLGLSIHSTAGFIDPGFDGYITLEITNHSSLPIRLYAGMWIAQIAFEDLKTPCSRPYGKERGSRYWDSTLPEPVVSRVEKNLG